MTMVGNTSEIHAVVPVVKARRSQRQTVIFRSDRVDYDHRLVIKVECPLSVISGSLTVSAKLLVAFQKRVSGTASSFSGTAIPCQSQAFRADHPVSSFYGLFVM